MGDPTRFRLFAGLISERFPQHSRLPIADVAAGKGYLKAELYRRGFSRVTAWDRRHKLAKPRPGQRYQLFNHRLAPDTYRLVIGMHPDEATDQIVLYAIRHRVPFVVCPCCILPTGALYSGPPHVFDRWFAHLVELARGGGLRPEVLQLPMKGKSRVLIGTPEKRWAALSIQRRRLLPCQ